MILEQTGRWWGRRGAVAEAEVMAVSEAVGGGGGGDLGHLLGPINLEYLDDCGGGGGGDGGGGGVDWGYAGLAVAAAIIRVVGKGGGIEGHGAGKAASAAVLRVVSSFAHKGGGGKSGGKGGGKSGGEGGSTGSGICE